MKPRPVTCIHVAAYLFSALVLGASAFSFYCGTAFRWISKDNRTITDFYVSEGFVVVLQTYDPLGWGGTPFHYSFDEPFGIEALVIFRGDGMENVGGFLSISYGTTRAIDDEETIGTVMSVQLRTFLFIPILWLFGFHPVRLRRRWRSERNVQPRTVLERANSN